MKSKSLIFAIGRLCQGGGERVCINLANEFSSQGIEVTILVFSLEDEFYLNSLCSKVEVVSLSSKTKIGNFLKLFYFLKKVDRKTPIISFNYNISFYLSLTKFLLNIEYISRSLNTLSKEFDNRKAFKDKIVKLMVVFGLKNSKFIISQSVGMTSDLTTLGITEEKIITINNPVSPDYFYNPSIVKSDYILFVGRLSQQKSIHYLLHALNCVDESYDLMIVGDGELHEELLCLTRELSLSNRVYFLGEKDNVLEYYQSAKLVVLSSLYEGFPNVLVESISCGTPVVSFNCPNGPSEIINEGVNGFLAKYKDVNDLSDKINKALSYNFDLNAVSKSANKYSVDQISQRYSNEIWK